jgi:hypothetical protein
VLKSACNKGAPPATGELREASDGAAKKREPIAAPSDEILDLAAQERLCEILHDILRTVLALLAERDARLLDEHRAEPDDEIRDGIAVPAGGEADQEILLIERRPLAGAARSQIEHG